MPVRALTGCDTVTCYLGIGKGTLALILSYLDDAIENVIAQVIEFVSACYLLLLLVWHAPLGARSAKRRHDVSRVDASESH